MELNGWSLGKRDCLSSGIIQRDRQTDRQTERETDRQTDRQTEEEDRNAARSTRGEPQQVA